MKSDKSRDTFHPEKHYSSVRLQQGRVLTDADWNEETDIERHRDVSLVRDMVGPTGVPEESDGFRAMGGVTGGIADIEVKRGRMYVDGILVEQDIQGASYRNQPDLPLQGLPAIPTTGGMFAAYLDVWDRHIGSLEDPAIREVALGGPDTTTRAKTVWQLKFLTFAGTPGSPPAPIEDVEGTAEWQALIEDSTSTGMMRARARPETGQEDPCIIPEAAGFRRLENQLYRVEIHRAGTLGGTGDPPTFVWSRDNGSVVAQWLDVPDGVNQLRVSQATRDEALGFAQGQWIELIDDNRELRGEAGLLVQILRVDGDLITYDPGGQTITFTDFPRNPKVRRWDSPGAINVARDPGTNEGYIALESGVEVLFENGSYRVGDYWMIPARTITGSIEWPADPTNATVPQALLATGIKHHFACLLSFTMPNFATQVDCRKLFPALTDLPTKGTEADSPPRSGQFRYYLVDGNAANDMTGVVGIDFDAATAFAEAVPFRTYTRVLQLLPRDGNDSTAIILIKPLEFGARYAPEFRLTGLHGYRRVYIRGSNLVNDDADRILCEAVPVPDFPAGVKLRGSRVRPFDSRDGFDGDEELLVHADNPLPADPTILNGTRARLISTNPSIGTFRSMVLRNEQVTSDDFHEVIRLVDATSQVVNPDDIVMLELPGTKVGNCFLDDISCPLDMIGIDGSSAFLERVFVPRRESPPQSGISFSFCRFGLMGVTAFHSVITETNPRPEDGRQVDVGVGACLMVTEGVTFRGGEQVTLGHFASAQGVFFDDVRRVTMTDTVITRVTLLTDCPSFRIGGASLPRTMTLNIGIGTSGSGSSLLLTNSTGVLDHVFLGTNDTDAPVIQLQGTGQRLDLLSGAIAPRVAGAKMLELLQASSSNVLFDMDTPAGAESAGSIGLATDLFFGSTFLEWTDTIDSAGNHVRGPLGTMITGGFRHPVAENVSGFNVVRFRRAAASIGSAEPKLIRAGIDPNDTDETEAAVIQSLAGVVQQGTQAANTGGRPIVVFVGYTLVSLSTDQIGLTPVFPLTLFLNMLPSQRGQATFDSQSEEGGVTVTNIRIGIALRYAGPFGNLVLARLQLPVS